MDSDVRNKLQQELASKLAIIEQSVNVSDHWNNFKNTVLETEEKIIGHPKRRNEDWFEDNRTEIEEILKEKWKKHQLFLAKESPENLKCFKKAKAETQRKSRELKNKWWVKKAENLERMATCNESKGFYNGLKAIFGPRASAIAPMKNKEGTETITDNGKMERTF